MLIRNIFVIEIVMIENYSFVNSLAIRLDIALKNDDFSHFGVPYFILMFT